MEWKDPIIEETRRLRESYAAEHNHDIDAICDDVLTRQAESKRKVVALPPRKPTPTPNAVR